MSEGFFKAASGENLWMYLIVLAFWGISAFLESRKKARLKREREARTTPASHREPVAIEETFERSMDHEEVPSEHIQDEIVSRPVTFPRIVHKTPTAILEKVSSSPSRLPTQIFPSGVEQAFIVSEILGKPKSQRRGRQ